MGGLKDEIPDEVTGNPRNAGALLHAAREWGLEELADRLRAACDDSLEPTWDRGRGEFTWGCGLNEAHPRGQFNALLALGEANTRGAWTRLASELLPEDEPLVVDVDFPEVALSEARWADGALHIRLHPMNESVIGRETSFRIIGLEDAAAWSLDGPGTLRVAGSDLVVTTRVDNVPLTVHRALG